jgi:RecB family exonuclease
MPALQNSGKPEQPGYPLSLLPFSKYQSCDRPERRVPEEAGVRNDVRLVHRHAEIVFPSAVERVLNQMEKRRGDLIHAILAEIQYMDAGPETAIERAIKQLASFDIREYPLDEVRKTLAGFLGQPEIVVYFSVQPGRLAWNEKELVDEGGRLFRIDRLVADPKEITVIDYKTGGQEDAEEYHLPQMRNYLHIVRGIYPDHVVSGIIAYVDQQKLRRIA